jgi:peroxiredoxin
VREEFLANRMTDHEGKEASGTRSYGKRLGSFANPAWMRVLLASSVVINILLASDVSSLRRAIEALKAEGRLQVGAAVPAIEGRSVDGAQELLNYNVSIPTVLYVFTPQCLWCKKNLANLHALIDNSGSRYRVVGVSLTREGLRDYLNKEHLQFPVYTDIADSVKAVYHLGTTPTTIVISPQARVLRIWYGAYEDGIRTEMEAYLNVHLVACCAGDKDQPEHP